MNDGIFSKRLRISLFGIIIPAILVALSTAAVALIPGLSSMVQTDTFSCHWQAIRAMNALQFYTTPSICSWLVPTQWILIAVIFLSIVVLFVSLKKASGKNKEDGMKKYYPVIGAGAVTVITFTVAWITGSNDMGTIGGLLLGLTYLIFIYTVQIKSDYIRPLSLRGSGLLSASKSQNPFGYWMVIVLETIAGLLIITLCLVSLIFGTLQFN